MLDARLFDVAQRNPTPDSSTSRSATRRQTLRRRAAQSDAIRRRTVVPRRSRFGGSRAAPRAWTPLGPQHAPTRRPARAPPHHPPRTPHQASCACHHDFPRSLAHQALESRAKDRTVNPAPRKPWRREPSLDLNTVYGLYDSGLLSFRLPAATRSRSLHRTERTLSSLPPCTTSPRTS